MIIGIAGMIAAGKSTLAAEAARSGILECGGRRIALRQPRVIEVDELGHRLLAEPQIVARLIADFGPQIAPQGKIDRRLLAQAVLGDLFCLRRLEAVLHPPMLAALRQEVTAARQAGADLLLVAALPKSFAFAQLCDLICVLKITRDQAAKRLKVRSPGMTGAALALIWRRQQSEYPCPSR